MDWAAIEKDLSGRGVTVKLLWEAWRETRPDGMSYVTWCRRFREWRPCKEVTMRQNCRPGERPFIDCAGMTVPVIMDGVAHAAQLFVALKGVSGRICAEAALSQKIEDWCNSRVHCFEDMGLAPQVAVPGNLKAAVTKPSRHEPVLNETCADLLGHCGTQGLPAQVKKSREKHSRSTNSLAERRVQAPPCNHVFHDLALLNRAVADGILGRLFHGAIRFELHGSSMRAGSAEAGKRGPEAAADRDATLNRSGRVLQIRDEPFDDGHDRRAPGGQRHGA